MSAKVQGFGVREPRVVARSALPSQRGAADSMSKLAQAWTTFGEAKSALEKLDSSSSSKRSHTHTTAPVPTTTTPLTRQSRPSSVEDGAAVRPSPRGGGGRERSLVGLGSRGTGEGGGDVPAGDARQVNSSTEGATSLSRSTRKTGDCKKRRRERHTNETVPPLLSATTNNSPPTTAKTTPPHPHKPLANTNAIFGPPVDFTSSKSARLEAVSPAAQPSLPATTQRRSPSSPSKIDLADNTLALLRSKVEAQKQAMEATNTRLQTYRQPPVVTSDPCLYPLPEGNPHMTQSSASSSMLLTSTSTVSQSHPPSHPPPPPHTNTERLHSKRRKVTSLPPPRDPTRETNSRLMTGTSSRTLTTSTTSGTRPGTGGPKVRKIGHVSAPVDPLRTRPSVSRRASNKTYLTSRSVAGEEGKKRISERRDENPPHHRSWALRPSATTIMSAAFSNTRSPPPEDKKPGLVPLGVRGEESDGGGGEGVRSDLSKMLQDLESEGGSEGEEPPHKRGDRRPFPPTSSSSSVPKKKKFTNPEDEPLPPPPRTKPYNHDEVQLYIRQKKHERRLEARRSQEERERERREKAERQRELVQRQRTIVLANVRHQQRERVERARDSLTSGLDSEPPLLTITSPYSATPRVHPHSSAPHHSHSLSPRRETHHSPFTSLHSSSHSISLSPRTYTVSSYQQHTAQTNAPTASGTSPPPPEGPFPTTVDQQTSREGRIRALTQSALELKMKIAAEADRLKKSRSRSPGHVNISVTTTPPPRPTTRPLPTTSGGDIPSCLSLPGVRSVHKHAILAEEARRQGEAATRIQAAFRGYRVRRSLQWQLPSGFTLGGSLGSARVGDGEEGANTRGNGLPKTTAPHTILKVTPDSFTKKPTLCQSVAVQTPAAVFYPPHFTTSTAAPSPPQHCLTCSADREKCPMSSPSTTHHHPPHQRGGGHPLERGGGHTWERGGGHPLERGGGHPLERGGGHPLERGGGDPMSVINILTRQKGHLEDTLLQLKTQKLSELRQLTTSSSAHPSSHTPSDHTHTSSDHTHTSHPPSEHTHTSSHPPSDHTHPAKLSHASSVDEQSLSAQHSLSSVSQLSATPTPVHHSSPPTVTPSQMTPSQAPSSPPHTATPSQHTVTPSQSSLPHEGDVPAITPPGSPSFVASFSAGISPVKSTDNTTTGLKSTPAPAAAGEPSRGPTGGRLSPRSLGLKLQAELTLLETIEESMRQLSAVEGTRALSTARQETVSLAQLLETQQHRHGRGLESARARAAGEERGKQQTASREEGAAALAELQRAREEVKRREEREDKRMASMKEEMAQRTLEATRELAETRAAASEAVINTARLQVEAAHNMAVSVATAAAKEAVSVALTGVSRPPDPPTVSGKTSYASDFEDSIQPDSLAGESVHTEVDSQLVPTGGTSSGDSTQTIIPSAVESEGGGCEEGGGDETYASIPEEMDGGADPGEESSFRELLPSESHRRMQSLHRHPSLGDSESHGSSPAHSRPHTPSSVPGDRSPSPFMSGEDSFFRFMSRMMEQYMKEEEVRSRHRTLLLQLREKTLQDKTKAELEWLKLKQQQMRGKGEDEKMPSLESRQRVLLRKLETEREEIRRLQKVQQEASRERRLVLEQHREISHLQKSAEYYRDKLRRYTARDLQDHLTTPSPSHHSTSPVPSEVISQVSEEDIASQSHISPSSTPSLHSSTPHHTHTDQSPSVAMPTDTANTTLRTPTIDKRTTRELKNHDRYLTERERYLQERRRTAEEALRRQEELARREQALDQEEREIDSIVNQALQGLHPTARTGRKSVLAPKKLPLLETTPTQPLATPTKPDDSEVISEVLDHTPSESAPEEVSEEASSTVPPAATEYGSDMFESPDHTSSSSHPLPITSTLSPPAQSELESTLVSHTAVSGVSLERRISQLRQQLEQRREEVRKARGEQRQRKRALLKQEEDRLRKRLESLDDQLTQLQSVDLTNHISSPPSLPSPPPQPTHLPTLPTSHPVTSPLLLPSTADRDSPAASASEIHEDLSHTPVSEDRGSEGAGSPKEEGERGGEQSQEEKEEEEEEEEEVSEVSELSQSVSEDHHEIEEPQHSGQTSGHPLEQISGHPSGQISGHPSGQISGQISGHSEEGERDRVGEVESAVTEGGEMSYTESWVSEHSLAGRSKEGVESHSGDLSSAATSAVPGGPPFRLGQRVIVGGAEPGTVRFIGPTHFKLGVWIGVDLERDKGKNDGSIDDQRYFSCRPGHGVFAPASKVASLGEEEEEEEGSGEGESTESNGESSLAEAARGEELIEEELIEEDMSEGDSGEVSLRKSPEAISPLHSPAHPQEGEGEGEETGQGNDDSVTSEATPSEGTHPGPGVMSEVEGSRDLDSSSPAVPSPLTLPQEELSTAPHLPAPPPDIATAVPQQTAESQTVGVHTTSSVEHMTSDLVQELANEAFQTMHKIWRLKSPSSPNSLTRERSSNHHLVPAARLEQKKKKKELPELSRKADRITDELFALLLKSETDLVCNLRSARNHLTPSSEPSSPHRLSPSILKTAPSLPTIEETASPPSYSPPPPPTPVSPPPSPPGSPPRHLPPAAAARIAAGERSPPLHRESPPPSLTPSLSCASLIDSDFVSANCMVPSTREQVDTIVDHTCTLWTPLRAECRGGGGETFPECPADILSLFSDHRLSRNEEHCQDAYVRLVYNLTLHVLQDMYSAPQPEVSVWMRHSPALNSQLVAAKRKAQEKFDLERVQKKVHGQLVRGQLPSPLPAVKFLHGMQRVGRKEVDSIDSILIHELRREEPSWVDYHTDETTVKLRVADGLLDSLLSETVSLMASIAERKLEHA